MSIEPTVVEDIITEAQRTYLDKTIITDDLIREPRGRTDHECKQEYRLESDQFNNFPHSNLITQRVSSITNCEATKFIEYLKANSSKKHQLGYNQFYMDLLGVAVDALSPKHIYLPKNNAYENELKANDSYERFNQHPKVSVHWFAPDIFSKKGFLIERGVYFRQRRQGDYTPMPNNISSSVNLDYADNRLQVNLASRAKTIVYLRSKFSIDMMSTGDSLIHELELPDPSKI